MNKSSVVTIINRPLKATLVCLVTYLFFSLATSSVFASEVFRSGDWSYSVESYALDASKPACVARTRNNWNNFEIIVPRDPEALPVVRLISTTQKTMIGAMYWKNNRESYPFFVAKEEDGQALYLHPKFYTEVITDVIAKTELPIKKHYIEKGKMRTTSATISLIGSSAVLKRLQKDCLNHQNGELFSKYQVEMLNQFSENADGTSIDTSYQFAELAKRGATMLAIMTKIPELYRDVLQAKAAVKVKDSDPDFRLLREKEAAALTAQKDADSEIDRIKDNLIFLKNADQNIVNQQNLVDSIAKKLIQLSQSEQSAKEKLAALELEHAELSDQSNSAKSRVDSASAEVSQYENKLERLRTRKGQIEVTLRSQQFELSDLQSKEYDLRSRLERAERNLISGYDKSRLVRRITDKVNRRYGVSIEEIEQTNYRLSNDLRSYEKREERVQNLEDQLSDFINAATDLEGLQQEIDNIQSRIDCYRKNLGAHCLQDAITRANRAVALARAAIADASKRKCWFPFGKKKCRNKKQNAIQAGKKRLAIAQNDLNDLNRRIAAINSTGKDPGQKADLIVLRRQKSPKLAEKKKAISRLNRIKDSIEINKRMERRFPLIKKFADCRISANRFCMKSALHLHDILGQMQNVIQEEQKELVLEIESNNSKITAMNSEIAQEVNLIIENSQQEYENAKNAYNMGISRRNELTRSVANLEKSLMQIVQTVPSVDRQLRSAERTLTRSQDRLVVANESLASFENKNDMSGLRAEYDNLVHSLQAVYNEKKEANQKLQSLHDRKGEVLAEKDKYPEIRQKAKQVILRAQQEMAQLDAPLRLHRVELRSLTSIAESMQDKLERELYTWGQFMSSQANTLHGRK